MHLPEHLIQAQSNEKPELHDVTTSTSNSIAGLRRDKIVVGVSNQAIPKPDCSTTETCKKIDISLVASLDYDTFQSAEQIERMCSLVCALVVRKFLASRPVQLIRGTREMCFGLHLFLASKILH